MTRPLKVWATDTQVFDDPTDYANSRTHDRYRRVIIATPTKKAALELLGMSRADFDFRGHETTRPYEVEIATAHPGVILVKAGKDMGRPDACDWYEGDRGDGARVIRFGRLLVPVEHVIEALDRFPKGYTVAGPRRPVYGTIANCRCGESFRSGSAPSAGGRADVRRQHRAHAATATEETS